MMMTMMKRNREEEGREEGRGEGCPGFAFAIWSPYLNFVT